MAISFQLNLTPNQIEFLQGLDLYADGVADLPGGARGTLAWTHFTTWVRKLIRDGLVEHVTPGPGQKYQGKSGDGIIVQAYRITDKGRSVLAMIEHDVNMFLERQKSYQTAKKNGRKHA